MSRSTSRQGNSPSPRASAEPKPGDWRAFLIIATVIAAAVCVLVGLGVWRIGIAGEWVWEPYGESANWAVTVDCLLVGAVLVGLVLFGLKRDLKPRLVPVVLVGLLFAAFTLGQVTPGLSPYGAIEDTIALCAPSTGGYYAEALRVDDVVGYVGTYGEYIQTLSISDKVFGHLADHPPGPIVLHWILNHGLRRRPRLTAFFYPGDDLHRLAESVVQQKLHPADTAGAGLAAWLFRTLAALTVLPAFLLGRDLYGRRAGIAAAALAALIPALHVFSPYPDQIQPATALAIMWLFARGVRSPRLGRLWLFGTGALLFAGMQFTLAFLTLVFTMGAWAALSLIAARRAGRREGNGDPRRWVELALCGALGIFLPALASYWILDYDVLEVWTTCLGKHAGFAATFHRTYWKWALFGPVEVALFAGVPISCLVLRRAVRHARQLPAGTRDERPHLDNLMWSLLVTAFALNVSGKSLGEVARLWIFFYPLLGVVGAAEICKGGRPAGRFVWASLVMLVQTIVFCASINAFGVGTGSAVETTHAQDAGRGLHAPSRAHAAGHKETAGEAERQARQKTPTPQVTQDTDAHPRDTGAHERT